jgi:oligoendopeptidase F
MGPGQPDIGEPAFLFAQKVEDMLNTVVRQIAFVEERVHDERREAELTPDRLGEIWLGVQRESLGPALRLDGVYRHYGHTSRISSILRSMSTPMPSATAW